MTIIDVFKSIVGEMGNLVFTFELGDAIALFG